MKLNLIILFIIALCTMAKAQKMKIAFGSCAKQYQPLPILDTIATKKPDLFVFLGDNIYADTDNKELLCERYDSLSQKSGFQLLQKTTPIIATWDDHDYGKNDAGKEFSGKDQSKQIFLDFFQEPPASYRYLHAGIYTTYYLRHNGKVVQFILLDTRTFRDSLTPYDYSKTGDSLFQYHLEYSPTLDSDATLLGHEQWSWLETQLRFPADIRIICTSIQFGHSFNGYESWNNFPSEKNKMIELLAATKSTGVVFISGDVHYGEISKNETDHGYPLFDITSSGLSAKWFRPAPNFNRIGTPIMENNFGWLDIDLNKRELTFSLIDVSNILRQELTLSFEELGIR